MSLSVVLQVAAFCKRPRIRVRLRPCYPLSSAHGAITAGLYNNHMSTGHENEAVLERKVETDKPPPMYKVVLLNDDFTPMEFVVAILQEYFSKDRQEATQIMLKVHNEGRGVCGVFSRDIASTKVDLVLTSCP